jgi:hypothetical protein
VSRDAGPPPDDASSRRRRCMSWLMRSWPVVRAGYPAAPAAGRGLPRAGVLVHYVGVGPPRAGCAAPPSPLTPSGPSVGIRFTRPPRPHRRRDARISSSATFVGEQGVHLRGVGGGVTEASADDFDGHPAVDQLARVCSSRGRTTGSPLPSSTFLFQPRVRAELIECRGSRGILAGMETGWSMRGAAKVSTNAAMSRS